MMMNFQRISQTAMVIIGLAMKQQTAAMFIS
jgi:hypothetical protein